MIVVETESRQKIAHWFLHSVRHSQVAIVTTITKRRAVARMALLSMPCKRQYGSLSAVFSPMQEELDSLHTLRSQSAPTDGKWDAGIGIVYFAMSPWEGMWKNRHQLMSRFARQMPVLYVEPPVQLRQLRRRVASGQVLLKDFAQPQIRNVQPGLHVLSSSARYPVSGSRLLRNLTAWRWRNAVKRALRKTGIETTLLWISQPHQRSALGKMREELSIYHVVDEYTGYTGMTGSQRARLVSDEQAVLDQVDLTVVVSPELAKARAGGKRRIRVVENAVDFDTYALARERKSTPEDMCTVRAPRIGYSGLIGKRLDLQLLIDLVKRRPEWSFVFIGKVDRRDCDADIKCLSNQRNVHFLGEKLPASVPEYIAALDIGLLPYAKNTETMNISPLKMYEYLAAGIPVVATEIPSASRHASLIHVAGDAEEFDRLCAASLDQNDAQNRRQRIEFASENTWNARVQEIGVHIHELLVCSAHATHS